MKKTHTFLFIAFIFSMNSLIAQKGTDSENCFAETLTSELDHPQNIPGETMGQKLESLLFWSQEEKNRRFPVMHSIYPSHPAPAGSSVFELKTGNPLSLKWEDNTTLDDYIKNNFIGGVLVLQNDEIRLEKYGNNAHSKTAWTSFSVAKSVTSMLLGVALKDGDIESMEDPLEKYIPELRGYDYGKVTVKQLLTMTSGIAWNEDYADENSDVAQMYQGSCEGREDHILSYMKTLKSVHKPGEQWNYSTGETDLLGILIQKATGKTLAEYLSEKIWKPYGMEQCAFWLADECSNLNIGGSGLSANLRDYARIGSLMLNNGKINGKNLLADEWIENATALLQKTDDGNGGYGYLWWRNNDGSYLAVGIFGQMIYVNPHKNLVITQFAAWPKASSKELVENRRKFIEAVERSL